MKKHLLIILLIYSSIIYSQNQFNDFLVTHNNDTIYGQIRIYESFLKPRLIDVKGNKHFINKRKYKTVSYNDKVYNLRTVKIKSVFSNKIDVKNNAISSDSIENLNVRPVFPIKRELFINKSIIGADYIINNKNDTLYGIIESPKYLGKYTLITNSGNKYIIDTKQVQSFRFKGNRYCQKKVYSVGIGKRKDRFVKIILEGKVNLYGFFAKALEYGDILYYVEKNENLKYVRKDRFIRTMIVVLEDNDDLVKRLKNREFSYDNIYQLIKEYNETSSN